MERRVECILNTLRAMIPISPDGKKLAFPHYTDGTVNIGTINLDGTEKKP